MRSRIHSWALVASALLAPLTSQVEAQVTRRAATSPAEAWDSWQADPYLPSPQSNRSHAEVDHEYLPGANTSTESTYIISDGDCVGDDFEYSDSDCCEPIEGVCDSYCAPYGIAAGAEATYLKPELEASGPLDPLGDYEFEAAPRIWLLWQTPKGGGLRARYWNLDAEQQIGAAGDFGDILGAQNFNDDLEVYAVDLELTRAFAVQQFDGWASFGARHGRLNRHLTQQITFFDVGGGGGDDASILFQEIDRGLEGTGITMAIDMRRRTKQSRLAGICNLRSSVLWGDNELDISGTVIEVVPVGVGDLDLNDFEQPNFFGRNDRGMWIGEIQTGGEWNTPISGAFGGGNAFVRVLFEAQWWNLPGVSTGPMGPEADSQMHQFLGVTAAAGITR